MRIAVIVLSLFSVSFAMAYFSALKRLSTISKAFSKMVVLNATMQEAFEASLQSPVSKEDQDIHKENFIKFLSDSRDWAFGYIEEVQVGLTKFVTDIEPEINYFKEYGDLISMEPNYNSLKKITKAYDELTKLLPKEEEEVK